MYQVLIRRLPPGRLRGRLEWLGGIAPGLLVSAVVALAATFLSEHYGGPVMLFALLLGMAFNFLSAEGACKAGIEFSARSVLRFGVALLGVRITLADALALGPAPLLLALVGMLSTIAFGVVMARALRFDKLFGILTGGAVGICGASAALAIASVLPKDNRDDESRTIFTVVAVTTLSTVAMVVYPILLRALEFSDVDAGVFLGGTIHDVAQVVGAGYSISTEAGDAATLTKLLRVATLVPVVLVLSMVMARNAGAGGKQPMLPAFLLGFVLLVTINSLGLVPSELQTFLSDLSRWSLVIAIAGLGMKTVLGQILTIGPRAFVLVLSETIWIALVGLLLLALL